MFEHPEVRLRWNAEQQNQGEEAVKRWLEEENNFSIYSLILANTCPQGCFKHLKIERNAALSSAPHPPETVSQTAVVIGSEGFFFLLYYCFFYAPLNEFLLCEANILWHSLRRSWISVVERLLLPFLHLHLLLLLLLLHQPTTPHLRGCSRPRAALASSKVKCTYISHAVPRGAARPTEGKITGSCGADLVLFWGSRLKGPRRVCWLVSGTLSSPERK